MTFIPQSAPSCNPPSQEELLRLLPEVCRIAHETGRLLMDYRRKGFEKHMKPDGSPVTEADIAAGEFVTRELRALGGNIPVVCEEDPPSAPLGFGDAVFWVADPLDATKNFITGNNEFSVNIALVAGRKPILGIIGEPATGAVHAGCGAGCAFRLAAPGAAHEPLRVREIPPEGATVYATLSRQGSNPHEIRDTLAGIKVAGRFHLGSALKFCAVAGGRADIYIRSGETCEWDTAAGQAIVEAAGGLVTTLSGAPFLYGKPDFLNHSFIARGLSK